MRVGRITQEKERMQGGGERRIVFYRQSLLFKVTYSWTALQQCAILNLRLQLDCTKKLSQDRFVLIGT